MKHTIELELEESGGQLRFTAMIITPLVDGKQSVVSIRPKLQYVDYGSAYAETLCMVSEFLTKGEFHPSNFKAVDSISMDDAAGEGWEDVKME